VCPGCRIMPVRAGFKKSDGRASLESDDIFNALTYAADYGADVINMSFGSSSNSATISNAVDYAYAFGVVLVASAGNSSTNSYSYPGALDKVISVGATNQADALADFSNYGSWVDIMAPGDTILSTDISGYSYKSGTSMSAPYVSGLAGLMISHNPAWTHEDVRAGIKASADPSFSITSGSHTDVSTWLRLFKFKILCRSGLRPRRASKYSKIQAAFQFLEPFKGRYRVTLLSMDQAMRPQHSFPC